MAYFRRREMAAVPCVPRLVERADVFVLIAGFRYGSPVQDRPEMSYRSLEFEAAGESGLTRLVFVLSDEAEGPAGLFRDPRHGARQEGFRARLADSGVITEIVATPAELEAALLHALTALPRARSETAPVGRVWGIPARSGRIHRPRRTTDGSKSGAVIRGCAVVHTLHGMRGVGKTTTAIEYAHRYGVEYDIAWCVPAENPALIPPLPIAS